MNVMPPGGYLYIQPGTGMRFDGNETFKPQCRKILAHRRGNRLPRATFDEVAEDVIEATCERLPNICVEGGSARIPTQTNSGKSRVIKRCGSCGGRRAK